MTYSKEKKGRIFIALMLTITIALFSQPKALIESGVSRELNNRMKDAVVMYTGSSMAYVNNMKMQIDPINLEVAPFIKNKTVYVPLRFAAEKLGAQVTWDESTANTKVDLKGNTSKYVLGVNDQVSGIRAEQIGNTVYVPLRLFAQGIGKKFFYHNGLIIISDSTHIIDLNSEKTLFDELISRVNVLPTVDTYENLKSLIEKLSSGKVKGGMMLYDKVGSSFTINSGNVKQEAASSPPSSGSSDYSKTNVQVNGVDEADIVKTDGEYIYQVNKQRIVVVKASPAQDMKVVSELNFNSSYNTNEMNTNYFNPQEMYVDGKYLVVIGSAYVQDVRPMEQGKTNAKMIAPRYPYYSNKNTVKAIIYDLADRVSLKKIREIEVEGNYISSRKIGSSLYLISNKNAWYYGDLKKEDIVPCYSDSNVEGGVRNVDYKNIHYFPGFLEPNFMNIAAVDLDSKIPINVSTYLGASEKIYASADNLYVASTNYNYNVIYKDSISSEIMPQNEVNTLVYKFALNKQNVTYNGKTEVPGTILNQFSMDEDNGYFRIATTVGEVSRTGESISKNNMYVLDEKLNITGRIEDIAPGERIYSVRFMGKKAYMVTFQKVDPLFVIDLSEPTDPKILGKLKIPGYSDYLHPYDENHIIGFGKDTVEAKEGTFAWYQGMKIAIFDVSDVSNPKEMFKEIIGDRGTYSELLNNHKALLFSKDKNLLAFPITVERIKNKQEDQSVSPQYGEFEFQGAYVYNIDLINGFKLKGKITHISDDEYLKSGSYWYNDDKNVQRILYIRDKLYTLSNGMIKANNMEDLKEVNSLVIQ